MLYIFLARNTETGDVIDTQSNIIRKLVADYPNIFGEPEKDITMRLPDDIEEFYIRTLKIEKLPTVVVFDEAKENTLKRWDGFFPDIKTLFLWARFNLKLREQNGRK